MAEDHSGFKALAAIDMNSNKINNVTDPTAAQDAATKAYVDAAGFLSRVRAYRNGTQSINASAITKVNLNAENYDGANEFNTSTYKFTAGSAGYYSVIAQVWLLSMDADSDAEIRIRVNGSTVAISRTFSPVVGSIAVKISDIIHLNANDYVELFIEQFSAAAKNINGTSTLTYMSLHRLS